MSSRDIKHDAYTNFRCDGHGCHIFPTPITKDQYVRYLTCEYLAEPHSVLFYESFYYPQDICCRIQRYLPGYARRTNFLSMSVSDPGLYKLRETAKKNP